MIKSIIARTVVGIAVAVSIANVANAANTPRITSVDAATVAGIRVNVVKFDNGITANVPSTVNTNTDDPKIGATTAYRFDNGWFTDGVAVEQAGGISFYGIVQ